MQKRIFGIGRILVGIAALVSACPNAAHAENEIQAFVSSTGQVVFTNLVENSTVLPGRAGQEDAFAPSVQVPASLRSLVDSISQTHGVDPDLVYAMMRTESNFNRWAVSSKGAMGLMQLIPATGRRFGVRDFFDPQQNIEGGVRYLKFLLDKFKGNIELSLAAYNAGENLVEKLGRIPAYAETQDYVRKIRAVYTKASSEPVSQTVAAADVPDRIFKSVDERGVVHFSNIEPLH